MIKLIKLVWNFFFAPQMPLSKEVWKVLKGIKSGGGRPLIVGGAVRDWILKKTPKDIDIEVYQMGSKNLLHILRQFGKVSQVGKSFGVFKLSLESGLELDVSLPRTENKEGKGHKGFIVKVDDQLTPEEAAKRRDYTFNSLMFDPFTKEVLDFFEGVTHLRIGLLQHTSEKFAEDALRVMRGMQFAGRMILTATHETIELCKQLRNEFKDLAKERLFDEWEKWALKSKKPSYGLQFLMATTWDECFPGLKIDADVLRAVDAMAIESIDSERRLVYMFSTLLSNVSKKQARKFLKSINAPKKLENEVVALVENIKMIPESPSEVRHLAFKLKKFSTIRDLTHVQNATDKPIGDTISLACIHGVFDKSPEAIITGDMLKEIGFKQGKELGMMLRKAFEAQLNGDFSDLTGANIWLKNNKN